MSSKSRAEQETICCIAADEDAWHVFSEIPKHVRRLTDLHGPGKPKGGGYVWRVAPTEITFRKQRTISVSEKEKRAEIMRRNRKAVDTVTSHEDTA